MEKQEETMDSFVCPSFSSYSSGKLADIADQVIKGSPQNEDANSCPSGNDFEFVTFRKVEDEVFLDGYVGPVYPIFNQDPLMEFESGGRNSTADEKEDDVTELQLPMRKLFIGDDNQRFDHDPPSSSSSSEVDDLDGIPQGTYCVWTPNSVKSLSPSPSASPSASRCKKSRSTGSSSSKRWKLLDLLRRSNSDGKESFVFLTLSSSASKLAKNKKVKSENSKEQWKSLNSKEQWSSGSTESSKAAEKQKSKGSAVAGTGEKRVSAHEAFYVRNRELRKVDKRRSYLPYRQDIVGFFGSLNGMGRAFAPF